MASRTLKERILARQKNSTPESRGSKRSTRSKRSKRPRTIESLKTDTALSSDDLELVQRMLSAINKPRYTRGASSESDEEELYSYHTNNKRRLEEELPLKKKNDEDLSEELLEQRITLLTDQKEYTKALSLLQTLGRLRAAHGKKPSLVVEDEIKKLRSDAASLKFRLQAESDAENEWNTKEKLLLRMAKIQQLVSTVGTLHERTQTGRFVPFSDIEHAQEKLEELSTNPPGGSSHRASAEKPPSSSSSSPHSSCIESMHDMLHDLEEKNFIDVLRCFQTQWENKYSLPKMFYTSKKGKPSVQSMVTKMISRLWRREEERVKTYGEEHNTSLFSWLYTGNKVTSPKRSKKKSLTTEIMKIMQSLYDVESRASLRVLTHDGYILLRGTIQLFSVGLVLEEMRTWKGV